VRRRALAAKYKIDLPYSGKSPGLYETALSNFLIDKPTSINAVITFHEAGKSGGLPMTRQVRWPSGASIADVTVRIAGVIGQFYGSVLKVFIGATVEFNLLESAQQLRPVWKLSPRYVTNAQAPRRRG